MRGRYSHFTPVQGAYWAGKQGYSDHFQALFTLEAVRCKKRRPASYHRPYDNGADYHTLQLVHATWGVGERKVSSLIE